MPSVVSGPMSVPPLPGIISLRPTPVRSWMICFSFLSAEMYLGSFGSASLKLNRKPNGRSTPSSISIAATSFCRTPHPSREPCPPRAPFSSFVQPTARTVGWTNEENGARGGQGSRDGWGVRQKDVAAIEMDDGVERPLGFRFNFKDAEPKDPKYISADKKLKQIIQLLTGVGLSE